jgi:VWFA-related protein
MVFLLAPSISWAQEDVEYQVHVDSKSLLSAIRTVEGRERRMVSFQFLIKRTRSEVPIVNIPNDEIKISEDGKDVLNLQIFQPRAQKLAVVLALDISGSMARGKKMEQAKQAALAFLDKLDERAEVGLVLFDHTIRVAEEPVREPSQMAEHRQKLRRLIQEAKPEGGTAYLDATVRALDMLRASKARRVAVVMTDGVDLASKVTLDETITRAVGDETTVYTIGIGDAGKSEPVHTVLVLDRSGSMLYPASETDRTPKIQAMKVAATRFTRLMRPGAEMTILPFSGDIDSPQPFTHDQKDLIARIQALNVKGGTLLYDATFAGVETLVAAGVKGRRAVVVLTDGRDEGPGSRNSDDAVIERAREAGIPLYMLGLGRKHEINEAVMIKMAKDTGGEYWHAGDQAKLLEIFENLSIQLHDDGIDEKSLGRLASETGGKYLHVKDLSSLSLIYERLADELQTSYRVTFESRRPSHDGTARGIDVRIEREGKVISTTGRVDDVARGVIVPQMNYFVYLLYLAGLGVLLSLPTLWQRLGRSSGAGQ